ncbi:hypothetical protein ERJ70_18955 [Sediminibacillus dalangtanensis]|uniref:DUF5067 domain-containing protein n=1 Tax=Sediminibacillus dalangtanensis TaxID=2729421 RepID=A0ABX7VWX4_9BACI|nr:hypothetical protein [Sediminibacillus dalangtanensis]QTN01177.1 hypothetical protein ERJ70_18955 [Sediminibacillus dalangtanensis]
MVSMLSACDSDSPGTFAYSVTKEKQGIEVTLDRVEEFQGQKYELTTFYYEISNHTDEDVIIETDIQENEDASNSTYLEDGEGNVYPISGYEGPKTVDDTEDGEVQKNPKDPGFIKIPADTNALKAGIHFNEIYLDSFKTQLAITLEDGDVLTFLFSGNLDEEHLVDE